MKNILTILTLLFTISFNAIAYSGGENWYICANCCKTKQADKTPWESGCSKSSGSTHNFWFCGKAGDFNYTCRKCDASVYLSSNASPSASKCCASGGTHEWFHK